MKTWYYAKCDKCMEVAHIMVKSLSYSLHVLSDQRVFDFMRKHYGCELTLGWRDDHLDKLWEEGYTGKDLDFGTSLRNGESNEPDFHPDDKPHLKIDPTGTKFEDSEV